MTGGAGFNPRQPPDMAARTMMIWPVRHAGVSPDVDRRPPVQNHKARGNPVRTQNADDGGGGHRRAAPGGVSTGQTGS